MSAAEFVAGKSKFVPYVPLETETDFLSRKIKPKDYSLSMDEILVLNGYRVNTFGDFLSKSQEEISFMKNKKGINLGNRFLVVYNKLKADYERKFTHEAENPQ